jgi:hypothetical protein
MGIIRRPVFCLKREVSENDFRLYLLVETTQFGRKELISSCLQRQKLAPSIRRT